MSFKTINQGIKENAKTVRRIGIPIKIMYEEGGG
jgi:hypothetical protein